ncbi:hypothetical protein V1264_014286 [Littorina saxatilis]|uniref:Vertnin n=1 Tax=Littorina saxatilis TaxID=31220 RepID=A0AAN9GIT6_9CAEN
MNEEKENTGGIFKYLLRRKRAYKYSFCDDDPEERTCQPKLTGYKALVQKHVQVGSLDTFRESEKQRVKVYRSSLPEVKLQRNRELQRTRQARHREKKKKEKETSGSTRGAHDRLKKDDDERKAAHREKMRLWRTKQTPEKRAYHNMKRMERYRSQNSPRPALDVSPLRDSSEGATTPPISSFAGSPFRSNEAKRQAASRASRQDPKDPVKYAEVKAYQLAQAMKSPRKRKALGEVKMPAFKMPSFAGRILQHLSALRAKKKKKYTVERKKLVSVLVQESTDSILSLSRQLDQRWHFVAAASTIEPEAEELLHAGRHGGSLNQDLTDLVEGFYSRPETSVMVPDRKMVKKDLVPRACLTSSLAKVHQAFLKETNHNISLTAFKKLRPQHILTMNNLKRTSCLCKMCTNVAQKLEVLRTCLPGLPSTLSELSDLTLCCYTDEVGRWTCIDRECPNCGVEVLTQSLAHLPMEKSLSWLRWQPYDVSSGQRIGNITVKGTLGELIAELAAELQPFACHLAVAFWQYRQFRQLRDHLPPNQVLTLLDFAENYRCDFQHEVQAAHWSYNQATVLPTVNYYRCTCGELVTECVVFISSDLQHDASAVHACTAQLLHHLREKRHLKVDRQFQFTDGAGSQFKSREPFTDLSCSADDFGVPIERSFFGTSHGKGPCDGVGGIVKSAVRRAVLSGKEIIRNAEEAFQYLKQNFAVDPDGDACCHSRRVFLRLEDINRKRPDRRPNNPVPGTRSIHCVRPEEPNTILHRRLSCYCAECMLGDPCHTMRTLPHGQWKSHVFRCPQAVPAAKPSDAKPSTASKPSDAKPSSATRPSDAKPSTAAKPSDATRPSDAKPSTAAKPSSATRPSDAKPSTAAKPSDAKPSSATRPSDAKPSTAAKPSDAKPSDAKPSDAKPSTAAKPSDAKPSTAAKPSDAKPSSATRPSDAKPSTAAKPSDAKPSTAAKPSDAKPSSATRPSDAKPSTAAKPSDATPSSATRPSDAKPSTAAEPSDAKPSTTPEPSDAKPSSAATPSDSKPFSDAKPSSAAKPSADAKPFAAMPCNAKRSTAPKRFAAKPSTAPKPSAAKCSTAPKPYHAKPSTAPKPFAAKPSDAKPSTAPKPSADPKCPPPLPMSFFRDMLKSLGKVKDWTTLEALAEQHHGLMQPVMMQQLDTSDFQIDEPSLALFPADVPSTSSLSPIAIYGDGNCLPRCGSVLAWGTQERHLEMRARIALELIINKSHYLSDPDSTFCAQYSEHFLNEKLTKAAIDNIFQLELRDIFKAGTYMGMWQVLALTSVLQHPILSIYPEYGGYTVRPHLHKLCTPRSQPTPAPHHSSTYLPGIMWTHIHGKCLPALTWRPNHFVVCLPSSGILFEVKYCDNEK